MKHALNFDWQFVPDYSEEYLNRLPNSSQTINIPHTVKEVPYNYFDETSYQKKCTYQKVFDINESVFNKIIKLVFDGFMLKAKVYLNDNYLGEYVSGYIKVEIDITQYVKQSGNKLIVVLDSKEDKSIPPFGYAVDYLTFGGIYREVSVEVHPNTYLENIFVKADMDGNVNVSYDKVGGDAIIQHELYFKDELITTSNTDSFKINNPKLWDINNPNLYTLVTTIQSSLGNEQYKTRFGFRNAIFKPDGFYLNNQKIKLRGLNRHQSYPFVGYAMPKSAQEEDADILKYQVGVNQYQPNGYH